MLRVLYQKKHMKYSVIWKEHHLEYDEYFFASIGSISYERCSKTLNGKLTCWKWHMSILVSETIRISMFLTAYDKSCLLFLIEFMLIWLIMTLYRLFLLNFFNVSLKLFSTDWQVIETDPLTFPDRVCEISLSLWIAVDFDCSNATLKKRVKWCAGSGIKLLVPEHPFTLQNVMIKFAKFFTNGIVPEKFKWSSFLPIQRSVMFLLSTTSILSCKR